VSAYYLITGLYIESIIFLYLILLGYLYVKNYRGGFIFKGIKTNKVDINGYNIIASFISHIIHRPMLSFYFYIDRNGYVKLSYKNIFKLVVLYIISHIKALLSIPIWANYIVILCLLGLYDDDDLDIYTICANRIVECFLEYECYMVENECFVYTKRGFLVSISKNW
jgi:hypothetical protein